MVAIKTILIKPDSDDKPTRSSNQLGSFYRYRDLRENDFSENNFSLKNVFTTMNTNR